MKGMLFRVRLFRVWLRLQGARLASRAFSRERQAPESVVLARAPGSRELFKLALPGVRGSRERHRLTRISECSGQDERQAHENATSTSTLGLFAADKM